LAKEAPITSHGFGAQRQSGCWGTAAPAFGLAGSTSQKVCIMGARVQTGLEKLVARPITALTGRRIGLLCNQASVDSRLQHARLCIHKCFPGQIKALFAPQHGFHAAQQDNMIESDDSIDPVLKAPVFSLYGRTRIPTQAMFDHIDTLLIDLQDVGTRVYTFIYTMAYCLEAAVRFGKKVIVLDRPNPIGGHLVEGNCLAPDLVSFVGRYPLPMRHGLTIGELALLFNNRFGIGCDLEVVPLSGWNRSMNFSDTGLPWVAPSPNLPTPAAAAVYPGQVIWEGTNVSEGRGTTQPFELFGAPFIDLDHLQARIDPVLVAGATLRPAVFEPTSNKWSHQTCYGFQIHVTDPHRFRPYLCSLHLLQQVLALHGDRFEWKSPPYEYEFEKRPIDLILGDRSLRHRIQNQEPLAAIAASWQKDITAFVEMSEPYRLYA
jgi:uncharacterized protein YbbC (DUF1343 family)